MKTGFADLPLHGGKAPRWLFSRMVKLSREITKAIVWDFGPEELLMRLSDPFWFQAFGCVLGFDWHSSSVTTTVCGALKEGLKGLEKDLGIFVSGGKGKTSRLTPSEIETKSALVKLDSNPLIYASRMSAKVDSAAIQDGYQLYQHTFIFTDTGKWSVVQQGMNANNRYARRYHWMSKQGLDFLNEPHAAICGDKKENKVLDMVSTKSFKAREACSVLSRLPAEKNLEEIHRLKNFRMPRRHEVLIQDINPDRLRKIFLSTYEKQPQDFEQLLGMPGVGPKTIRALALLSELLYGSAPSFDDPVRYSFTHGGKDGFPYPVNKPLYDKTIDFLHKSVNKARLGESEKMSVLKRLHKFN